MCQQCEERKNERNNFSEEKMQELKIKAVQAICGVFGKVEVLEDRTDFERDKDIPVSVVREVVTDAFINFYRVVCDTRILGAKDGLSILQLATHDFVEKIVDHHVKEAKKVEEKEEETETTETTETEE